MDINTYTPDLYKYLPTILKEVEDFQALYTSENPEFCSVWNEVKNTMNNQFLDDLTMIGINRWESILGLNGEGSLSDRRLRIKAQINKDGTYTFKKLQESLNTLCGSSDEYTCVLDADQYTLTVRVKLTSSNKLESVRELLNEVTPANLIIDLSLLYNQHSTLANYTHSQLSGYTHNELRNSTEIMSD